MKREREARQLELEEMNKTIYGKEDIINQWRILCEPDPTPLSFPEMIEQIMASQFRLEAPQK